MCHEKPGLEMDDGTTKIILNATGTADDIDPKLKAFLDYVAGKPATDDYTKKLEDAVKKARLNKEWRRQYMTMMMRDLENQEIGILKQRRELAQDMLSDNKPIDEILKYSKLKPEALKEVADSMNITVTIPGI